MPARPRRGHLAHVDIDTRSGSNQILGDRYPGQHCLLDPQRCAFRLSRNARPRARRRGRWGIAWGANDWRSEHWQNRLAPTVRRAPTSNDVHFGAAAVIKRSFGEVYTRFFNEQEMDHTAAEKCSTLALGFSLMRRNCANARWALRCPTRHHSASMRAQKLSQICC
jgi:hypothetical protein